MNEGYTYDPEDLESLLRHKSFSELYPEEREFVLKHLSGEEEYTSMRVLLETLESAPEERAQLRDGHKSEVMAAFRKQKRRPQFSLNQFFAFLWPADRNFYQRPAFALGVLVLLLAGFVAIDPFSPNGQDGLLAEHVKKTETEAETETETKMKRETETETETKTEMEVEGEMEAEVETDIETATEEPVKPEAVEEVIADEPIAEVDDDEDVREVYAESANVVEEADEEEVAAFDQVADLPSSNRLGNEAGAPAEDESLAESIVVSPQTADDSVSPIENPVVTFSSPEVVSTKSVATQERASVQIEEISQPKPQPLLKNREQKKLMKLMYSAY